MKAIALLMEATDNDWTLQSCVKQAVRVATDEWRPVRFKWDGKWYTVDPDRLALIVEESLKQEFEEAGHDPDK